MTTTTTTLLSGKNALITGGTTGIGRETAELFRAHGASVAVTGNDEARLQSVREALPEVRAIRSDVRSIAGASALAKQVEADLGGLDVVFLNAGIAQLRPFEAVDEQFYAEHIGYQRERRRIHAAEVVAAVATERLSDREHLGRGNACSAEHVHLRREQRCGCSLGADARSGIGAASNPSECDLAGSDSDANPSKVWLAAGDPGSGRSGVHSANSPEALRFDERGCGVGAVLGQ
jgi:hypothetical protein